MRRLRSLGRQVEEAVRFQRYEAWLRQGEVFLGMARYRGGVEDRRVDPSAEDSDPSTGGEEPGSGAP